MRAQMVEFATSMTKRWPGLRRVPKPLKRLLRALFASHNLPQPPTETLESENSHDSYAKRLAREREIFNDQVEVHDLPAIFHYWSNTHLRPQLEQFGFSNPDQFFALFLASAIHNAGNQHHRFASVGCGNCDTEIRVAALLVEQGIRNFSIDCLDINAEMLERGESAANEAGVTAHIRTQLTDFNIWQPEPGSYSAVMANQSLHHVVDLENLFSVIELALAPEGRFLTSDMIGRNGHMRWPEAMSIVHEYWRELPETYRWNRQLKRHEELYEFWDCSNEGFEGIRAQDILPLLIERFDFELFLPFGNVIDPFIDRSFGGNFDAESAADRDLIDRIHARDVAEMRAGTITPTHLIAVMRKRPFDGECLHPPGLGPERCVRDPQQVSSGHRG